MKKLLTIVLALVMLAGLVACGGGSSSASPAPAASTATATAASTADAAAPQEESLVITISVPNLANAFWVSWTGALQSECDELGHELIIHDAKGEVANQITALENWITQEVNAVILAPVDADALQVTVDEALSAGIPIINAATRLANYTAYVGVDQYTYGSNIGQSAADWINANLADQDVVEVAILNDPTQKNMIERALGIVETLTAQAPNVEIVAEQAAYTADDGVTAAEVILQSHPDIDCFVGINDSAMLGAYEAIIASGADTSKMCLVACDGDVKALELVQADTCYRATVAIDVAATAHLNLWQAIDAANGKEVEDVKTQTTPITIDNVEEWLSN